MFQVGKIVFGKTEPTWKIPAELIEQSKRIDDLKKENEKLKADKAELVEWAGRVCDMQMKNYGKGFDTHISLIGLCEIGRHLIAKHTEVNK